MKIGPIEFGEEDYKSLGNFAKWIWRQWSIPKNEKNKIGIIVAIKTESKEEQNKLDNDLIFGLREYLREPKLAERFHLIIYDQQLCSQIVDSQKADKYLRASRAHLIVWGHLVQRNFKGNPSHLFALRGIVRHAPISLETQRRLSEDFATVLPPQPIIVPESEEIFGFEATKNRIGFSVRLIIGTAALVSGDFLLSYELLDILHGEIIAQKENLPEDPGLSTLENRVRARLIETISTNLAYRYEQYSISRNEKYILSSESLIKQLLDLDPDNYAGNLHLSILKFKQGHTDEAIQVLEEKKRMISGSDALWRYNLGFLYAHKGEVGKALEEYRRATYGIAPTGAINDIDLFYSEIIKDGDAPGRLYFFRGLVNYKAKPDYDLARSDFEYFLKCSDAGSNPELVVLAKKYLDEISESIGD